MCSSLTRDETNQTWQPIFQRKEPTDILTFASSVKEKFIHFCTESFAPITTYSLNFPLPSRLLFHFIVTADVISAGVEAQMERYQFVARCDEVATTL